MCNAMLHTTHSTTLHQLHWTQKRQLLRQNPGLIRRVARLTGTNPSTVSRVYWDKATSRRVQEALERELGLREEVTS